MGGSTSVAFYVNEETQLIRKVKEKITKHCKLRLKRVSANSRASPLLVFCEIVTSVDPDVNEAIKASRGGNDVFVVIIKTCHSHPGTNKHLSDYLQTGTRARIGDACIFFYNIDLTSTNFHEDNKIACHGLKRFMTNRKNSSGIFVQPHVTFEPHPYLDVPVCYYFEARSRMEHDTVTFVQTLGQFSLQGCRQSDVRSVSPLVVFTPNYSTDEEDVSAVLRQARDGEDVFLMLVRTKHSKQGVDTSLRIHDRTRQRVGELGALIYSMDSKQFQESSKNMVTIQKLRQFLINTVDHNASNSLRRSRTNLDDGRGTMI